MVSVVVFEFSGMRCQPLRRALAVLHGGKNEFLGVFYTFYSNSMCLFTCIDWSCD